MRNNNISWKLLLILGLLSVSFTGLLFFSEIGTRLNLKLVDSAFGTDANAPPQHIVMAADLNESLSDNLSRLQALGPTRVYWLLPDEPTEPDILQRLQQSDVKTIKSPSRQFDGTGHTELIDSSQWKPTSGYLIPLASVDGVSREIPIVFQGKSDVFRSPISFLDNYSETTESRLLMDFSKVNLNAPFLMGDFSANLELLENQVSGKSVFLISEVNLYESSIRIPGDSSPLGWHPIQYLATSIAAFEGGAYYSALDLVSLLIVVLLTLVILISGFLYLPAKLKRQGSIIVSVLILLSVAVASRMLQMLPPIVELLTVSLLFFMIVDNQFAKARVRSVRELDEVISEQLAQMVVKAKEGANFWDGVADMVTQSLHLNRSIFLQTKEGTNHVAEIASINCSFDDIKEMRRDFRREPYLQATKAKQAILPERTYFSNKEANEQEILAPFFRGTEILGFWALTTTETEPEKKRLLIEQVNLFALQISTLLNAELQSSRGERQLSQFTRRFGNFEQQMLQLVRGKLDALISNDYVYNSLFKSMSTPAILFNVFGQATMVNRAMMLLANRAEVAVTDINAFQFLTQVLPSSGESLKNIIRQLSLEQSSEVYRFFVVLNNQEYMVVLSALHKDIEHVHGQEVHVKLNGLLCEFHSLKEVQTYLQVERSLYDDYLVKIKNHLSTLQMGLMQIEAKAKDKIVNQLGFYLNQELKLASDITRRTHYFMNRVVDRKNTNVIPFNPFQTVRSLCSSVENSAKEHGFWRGVEINQDLPAFTSLGLGQPETFEKLLKTVFKLLVDDAIAPKKINVIGRQYHRNDVDLLYIKLDSAGYGLPQDQLRKLKKETSLLGEKTVLSELLQIIKTARESNIDCRLKSKVGKGYRLSILIEGISLDD